MAPESVCSASARISEFSGTISFRLGVPYWNHLDLTLDQSCSSALLSACKPSLNLPQLPPIVVILMQQAETPSNLAART